MRKSRLDIPKGAVAISCYCGAKAAAWLTVEGLEYEIIDNPLGHDHEVDLAPKSGVLRINCIRVAADTISVGYGADDEGGPFIETTTTDIIDRHLG